MVNITLKRYILESQEEQILKAAIEKKKLKKGFNFFGSEYR